MLTAAASGMKQEPASPAPSRSRAKPKVRPVMVERIRTFMATAAIAVLSPLTSMPVRTRRYPAGTV